MKKDNTNLTHCFLKPVILIILLMVPLTGCPADPLETWSGSYSFGESGPENSLIVMEYGIKIYKENDVFFATIEIDGFQTMTRIKAKVTGDQKQIVFIFEEYLPDNLYELYNRGDILLGFERSDKGLITHWRKMTPALTEGSSSGEYFKPVSK